MARPLSLSVEGVRAKLLERVMIPPELISKALRVTEQMLDAKQTKFFTHQGVVTDTKTVRDNTASLAAADQLYSLAGMYAREDSRAESMNNVTVEIDSKTGVIRLVVGERSTQNVISSNDSHLAIHDGSDSSGDSGAEQLPLILDAGTPPTMKPRGKYSLPNETWRTLLDEDDD